MNNLLHLRIIPVFILMILFIQVKAQNSIFSNGDFEDGLTGWNVAVGEGAIETDIVFDGSNSLRVGPTSQSWVQQSVTTGFIPGGKYMVRAAGRLGTATTQNGAKVAIQINEGGDLAGTALNFNSEEYVEKSVIFTVPANATSVKVYGTNRTFGLAYFDNIEVIFVDEEAPSVPGNLEVVAADTTANVTWTASTDNVGVTGYNVYLDDVLFGTVTSTSYELTGLTAGTNYTLGVSAVDAAQNESDIATAEFTTESSGSLSIFTNGDFEDGLTGWNVAVGEGAIETDIVFEGSNSLRVGPTSQSWVQQSVTEGFTPGGRYLLKAAGRLGTATTQNGAKVAIQINEGGDLAGTALNFNTTEYEEKSVEFTIPANATSVKVYGTNRTFGLAYFDNIEVTYIDDEAPSVPGNLEVVVTDTTANVSWSASTDNVGVTGYNVYLDDVLLETVTSTSYELTDLTAGTTYTVGISAVDAAENESERATAQFTFEPDTTPVPEVNLLQNGGFENDLEGWRFVGGEVSINTDDSFQGDKAVQVGPTGYSTVDQMVNEGVIPGARYRLSAAVKSVSGTTVKKVALQVFSGSDFVVLNYPHAETTNWQEKSIEFTMPLDATQFVVYITNRGDGAIALADEVKVMLVADDEAPSDPADLLVVAAETTATLTWTESTDNVMVTGYKIFLDDNQVDTTTTASYEFTGLTAGTTYTASVIAFDAYGNESEQVSVDFTTEMPTSTDNLAAHKISVYPNPFSERISIEINEATAGKVNFLIISADGRIALQGELSQEAGSVQTIDTKELATGLYILQFTGGLHSTMQIIKR
jgi:chitodextrinase